MANRQKTEHQKRSGSFLSGVFVLSLSTVIVKVIGLACKIPLIAVLGAEGMGYFNSAYEIYALLCTVSTAGLPVALAMLISAARERGDRARIARVYRTAVRLFCVLGGVGTALMLLFSRQIASALSNRDASFSILAIAPALLCVCVASAVRGYFQGHHRMGPTAISQLIEAVGKLLFGVLFAVLARKQGSSVPIAAAYAVFGISIGTALSALYLLILKTADRTRALCPQAETKTKEKGEGALLTLVRIAFPITVSSAVLGVTRMADMALIMRRLTDIGVSLSRANAIYGSYTTLALPVFSLIPALITPIALSLVPQLAAAIESRTKTGQTHVVLDALRLTVLLALPASMGITLYARPILSLLFSGEPDAVTVAAPLLSMLGVSVFFSCMITTTSAILQSYRRQKLTVLSTVCGALVKIAGAYVLIGVPSIGILGAPISTFLCNLTVTLLNLWFIHGCVPNVAQIGRLYGRPLLASLGALMLSFAFYLPTLSLTGSERLGFFVALPVALAAYAVFSILTRTVTRDDLEMLPFGKNKNRKQNISSPDPDGTH